MTCPICTVATDTPHDDEACIDALIESGTVADFPWFNRKIPPPEQWSPQERQMVHDLALQAVRWKKAELVTESS